MAQPHSILFRLQMYSSQTVHVLSCVCLSLDALISFAFKAFMATPCMSLDEARSISWRNYKIILIAVFVCVCNVSFPKLKFLDVYVARTNRCP